jgi:hypothetical protein
MFNSRTKAKLDPNRWLRFVIGSAVCRWTSSDGKQRVYLIGRSDGGFSCASEYFSDNEFERCWLSAGVDGSIFASEEIAVREIHAAYPWLRDARREERQNI